MHNISLKCFLNNRRDNFHELFVRFGEESDRRMPRGGRRGRRAGAHDRLRRLGPPVDVTAHALRDGPQLGAQLPP